MFYSIMTVSMFIKTVLALIEQTVVGICFSEQSVYLYRLFNLTIFPKVKITNMSPAKKTDSNPTPKKGTLFP